MFCTYGTYCTIQLCGCVSFWFWREIEFGFTYLCTLSKIQLWCCVIFLVLAGNSYWLYVRIYCTIQLCGCVSFLVVVENSSQNEDTFLQKNLIGLLYYYPIAGVCIYMTKHSFTLYLSFFIFLLYRIDSHIEVQIRIYLRINIENRVKNVNTDNCTMISLKMPIPFLFFEKQLASKTILTFNMY